MKKFSFQTKCLGLFCAVALLSACSLDAELGQFRDSVPRKIAGLEWQSLAPIGDFAPQREFVIIPNPASLAARAASLRIRAKSLLGPVLTPARERAMLAALRRYNQG